MSFLYVKCYYGPCKTFHNNTHKPQLLYGLREGLQNLGYRVDLLPVDFQNYCMLSMCGREIFRCGIHNFHFNTTNHRDSVCQKAIDAVLASSVKIRRAGAYPWFWTIIEDEMFKRGKYTAVDYWIRDIKVEYSVPCKHCEDYYLKDYQAIEDRKGLQKIGYRVVLIPVHYADYCMIEMCGHEVFRCNIKQLKFNTCSEEDPVCARAIDAVIRSSAKFRQARAYFFAWNLIEQAIFQRSKHAPKDFWLTEEDVSSHLTSPEPVNCCDLDAEMKTLFESRPIIGFDF